MGKLNTKDSTFFRAGVGVIILNPDGRVLVCQRVGGGWQLPQGGILEKETEFHAAVRETKEETGIKAKELQLIGVHPVYLSYRLPEPTRKHGIGQTHRWFAFRYTGGKPFPKLPKKGEFKKRAWTTFSTIAAAVTDIKKPVYAQLQEWLATFGTGVQL